MKTLPTNKLENFIAKLRERYAEQGEYCLESNVPAGRTLPENVEDETLLFAISSAINGAVCEYDATTAVMYAHEILTDCNFHGAAKELVKFMSIKAAKNN